MDTPARTMADIPVAPLTEAPAAPGAAPVPACAQPDQHAHGTPLALNPQARLKVIVNPASGKKGGITTNAVGIAEVSRALEAAGIQADVFQTRGPEDGTVLAME